MVILATDGLWHNLRTEKIVEYFNKFWLGNKHESVYDKIGFVAENLACKAEEWGYNKNYSSPYYEGANALNMTWIPKEGIPSDISIVISEINSAPNIK